MRLRDTALYVNTEAGREEVAPGGTGLLKAAVTQTPSGQWRGVLHLAEPKRTNEFKHSKRKTKRPKKKTKPKLY